MSRVFVEEDEYKGCRYYITENSFGIDLALLDMLSPSLSWYCGYVIIPKTSSLYKLDTSDDKVQSIDVHGGITFADYMHDSSGKKVFCLGFDCSHAGDNIYDQDLCYVREECKKLIEEIIRIDKESE